MLPFCQFPAILSGSCHFVSMGVFTRAKYYKVLKIKHLQIFILFVLILARRLQ